MAYDPNNPLSVPVQAKYAELEMAANRVATNNPGMDMRMVREYLSEYKQAALAHDQELRGVRQRANANHIMVDPRQMTIMSDVFSKRFTNDFYTRNSNYRTDPAWQAFAHETQPKSLFDPLVKLVYDSNKGGVRIGGIVGGIVGFIASNGMIPEGQGIVGLIARAFAVGLAAWGGNKIQDMINHYQADKEPVFPARTPAPAPARTPAAEPAKTTEITPAQTAPAAGQTIPEQDIGNLPSPLAPVASGIPQRQPVQGTGNPR